MASNGHRGTRPPLLTDADPAPATIVNPEGRSPFLLIGDHAGNVIPSSLGTLGLGASERERHIAWDIGVAGLGLALSGMMDAVFVRQTYSRLVIDCNRDPGAVDAMPTVSDGTVVPGNADLSPEVRSERISGIHTPYHQAIADELVRRDAIGQPSLIVSLHSFTPFLADGMARPWQIGVLHDAGDPSLALDLLAALRRRPGLTVGDNEPYRMDRIDYTIPRHAYPARRPYVEVEIRQDLLGNEEEQRRWATVLMRALEDPLGARMAVKAKQQGEP